MNPVLSFDGLSAGYAPCAVVAKATADVLPGEVVFVVGPNGSGKSTLLRTLAGLQRPLAGAVQYDGEDATRWPVRRLAQFRALVLPTGPAPGWLRVRELVALGASPHVGWHGRLDAQQALVVAEAMALTQTTELSQREVATLSDGERQRVWLARALAQQPRLLLLDEPTHHLDPPARLQLLGLLQTLARTRRMAIIASLHEPVRLLHRAHQVWCCDRGSLHVGTPEEAQQNGWLEWLDGELARAEPLGMGVHVIGAMPVPEALASLLTRMGIVQDPEARITIQRTGNGWQVAAPGDGPLLVRDLLALGRWLQAQANKPQSSQ